MASAKPGAIVTVEVFVEQNEIFPIWIALKELYSTGDGTAAIPIAKEDANEPAGDFTRHLPQVAFLLRVCRALHFEVLAVVVVKLLKRFDEKIVYGKPDGAAPV
jgi:hypothetical protein